MFYIRKLFVCGDVKSIENPSHKSLHNLINLIRMEYSVKTNQSIHPLCRKASRKVTTKGRRLRNVQYKTATREIA